MRRREFITLVAAVMACPVARAQEVRKIVGVLQALAPPSPYFHAFQNRLRELGWVEGLDLPRFGGEVRIFIQGI